MLKALITVYRGYDQDTKRVSATMVVAMLFIASGVLLEVFGVVTNDLSDEQIKALVVAINDVIPAATAAIGVLFAWLRKRKDKPVRNGDHPARRRTDHEPEDYLDR